MKAKMKSDKKDKWQEKRRNGRGEEIEGEAQIGSHGPQ